MLKMKINVIKLRRLQFKKEKKRERKDCYWQKKRRGKLIRVTRNLSKLSGCAFVIFIAIMIQKSESLFNVQLFSGRFLHIVVE